MGWLLGIAGALVVFLIGWSAGRRVPRREPAADDAPVSAVAPQFGVGDLLDTHPTGIVVLDERLDIRYRNLAAQQFDGTHVGVLLKAAVDEHAGLSRSQPRSTQTLEIYGPPKTILVVEARPLPKGGAVVFVDDISERRRIDQVRTDFIANVSHELKTPVGALSVLAETLEEDTDPETTRRVVGRMMNEAQRASRTIDDLLELSRIELGSESSVEPVDVGGVIAEALGRVTELARSREIGVAHLGPADAVGAFVVQGDRRQLVSAVGNLVENAVKYSEPGGSVQVRTRRVNESVEISVTDQGPGIPQRDLARVFERFYRVDQARSRMTGGTGLGLSIVRHVATNHGGDIEVESVEGEGSTFTLRLPAPHESHSDASIDSEKLATENNDTTDEGVA